MRTGGKIDTNNSDASAMHMSTKETHKVRARLILTISSRRSSSNSNSNSSSTSDTNNSIIISTRNQCSRKL
jgi:hypothetical protein